MKSFNKMNSWLFVVFAHLISSVLTHENIVFPCITQDHEMAYCVSLFSCPHMMKSLSTLDPRAIDNVKKSICLGCEAGDFMVCCGTPKNVTEPTTTTEKPVQTAPSVPSAEVNETQRARREYVKTKLLPSQRICGQQHTDDRVYLKNETAIDEFPWLAFLESNVEERPYGYTLMCTGALITNRYVLTDANCGIKASIVRLGLYSTHKDVSCVQETSLTIDDCTPTVTRGIDKLVFSGYSSLYNLIVIRLNKTVDFSEYIRPICLPTTGSRRPIDETYLTFSGFGADDQNAVIKKRITYNLTNAEVCYEAETYGYLKQSVEAAKVSLACLVPPPRNTLEACIGEHGGPLMYKYRHRWFAEAIIIDVVGLQNNVSICSATAPVSGVYLTPTMMDWIYDNIED